MSGKQHVEIHRKLGLRRSLLVKSSEGAVYVPFCGDGDIAVEVYGGRNIYAADIDSERVRTAIGRLPSARVIEADCDRYPFGDVGETFAVADFDSYAYPYAAFRTWWEQAAKADRLVLFFTDGERQGIKRSGVFTRPDGNKNSGLSLEDKRQLYNFYWVEVVKPWFIEHIRPYSLVETQEYLCKDMLYWGALIRLEDGDNRQESAENNLDVQIKSVEEALYKAAVSGNVPAMQMWLYNRAKWRWVPPNAKPEGQEVPYRKDGAWD